jgi:hypothetical protein
MIAAVTPPIGALIARARRQITSHFLVHHATSAEDAVAFVPQRLVVARQFERMQARGIVREAGGGRFWIDTAAYQADNDRRRRILVPLALVLILVFVGTVMWAGYRG